jgi:hypothetical protein
MASVAQLHEALSKHGATEAFWKRRMTTTQWLDGR